ncbi:MAG: acyl-protein synthetase [Pseudomonadota bacterium]|nr:acyl-protein synthetase [Pseudomonadota bacterium]
MFALADIIDSPPFSLSRADKTALYVRALSALTNYHYENCAPYRRLLDVLGVEPGECQNVEDFPFIPVRLFKEYDLLSTERAKIVKTMTSSGTTGQRPSKIFLDRDTAANQTRVLTKLLSTFLGKKRLPMLVIDTRAAIKDRNLFSARGAGILGFSMCGYDVTYALDEHMQIDIPLIQAFIEKHADEHILLFGFTFMIWEHFYSSLKASGVKLSLERGILIHGGGWKKLIDEAVDNDIFKKELHEVCGISRIYNYYGMVEQTGSIFMECEAGRLHASIFSDILIRDHRDFSSLPAGKQGLVQLLSLLPLSYPGHSLLSEDVGEILGEDDCPCGRMGKYFAIHGRIKNAETRGCSDTYASRSR